MEDDVLKEFYKFVHTRDPHITTWDHHFVITLVDEIVRLRNKYENLELELNNFK